MVSFKARVGVVRINRIGLCKSGRARASGQQTDQCKFGFHSNNSLIVGLINYFLYWVLRELLLRRDDTEFDRDFISHHAGVFPFTFTDVVGQAFDR
ncbi:hypothetical protein D3C79_958800 [compost metagenome]